MANQEGANRKIAEWLGCADIQICECSEHPIVATLAGGKRRHLNFFTDEEANVLILDHLPVGMKLERLDGGWSIHVPHISVMSRLDYRPSDRKTVICNAALEWIERQERQAKKK